MTVYISVIGLNSSLDRFPFKEAEVAHQKASLDTFGHTDATCWSLSQRSLGEEQETPRTGWQCTAGAHRGNLVSSIRIT